jgi:hypothetical protein
MHSNFTIIKNVFSLQQTVFHSEGDQLNENYMKQTCNKETYLSLLHVTNIFVNRYMKQHSNYIENLIGQFSCLVNNNQA